MKTAPYLLIKMPLFTLKWSFITGTVLLLLHILMMLFNQQDDILIIAGIYYVMAAFAINSIVFLVTLIASFWHIEHQNQMITDALLQLVNIPVAVAYFYIVVCFNF